MILDTGQNPFREFDSVAIAYQKMSEAKIKLNNKHEDKPIKKEKVKLDEGRKFKVLKGHPYHAKSDAELHYIIKDAGEAARAQNSNQWHGFAQSESKYLDQVNDAATVLGYRRRGGKQDVPKKPIKESQSAPGQVGSIQQQQSSSSPGDNQAPKVAKKGSFKSDMKGGVQLVKDFISSTKKQPK